MTFAGEEPAEIRGDGIRGKDDRFPVTAAGVYITPKPLKVQARGRKPCRTGLIGQGSHCVRPGGRLAPFPPAEREFAKHVRQAQTLRLARDAPEDLRLACSSRPDSAQSPESCKSRKVDEEAGIVVSESERE